MKLPNKAKLKEQYTKVEQNWRDIYGGYGISSEGNTEIISEHILNEFEKIKWSDNGLLSTDFQRKEHRGYIELQDGDINPFNERRFCRALFNEYNKNPHPLLGMFLDYEIPQTERGQGKEQGKEKVTQGDIDLISCRDNELLFIEAKVASPYPRKSSSDSLLKAILEIFVYVMRLKKYKRLPRFLSEYGKPEDTKITPCILTFVDALSGKQLKEIDKYPNLVKLIAKINENFKEQGINILEYYLVENPIEDFIDALKKERIDDKNYKVTFTKEIQIARYSINR